MRRAEILGAAAIAAVSGVAAWALPRPVPPGAALAIAFAWACLFLYVPFRILAWLAWRQVEAAVPRPEERRALPLVLVLGFGLLIWGIEWGLIGHTWAADELRVDWVRDVLHQGLSSGWYDKYPWMHYAILTIPVSAFELAERLGIIAPDGRASLAAQLLLMRAVSVMMGLGTLVAAYLCGVQMIGVRRAVLAPLAVLLTPVFVYYGKTANLDVPSLCWFGWAMVAFLRILRGGTVRDYVWLGVAAAGSIATKDQAYASLGLVGVAVVIVTASREQVSAWWSKLARSIVSRKIVVAAAAALLAAAGFYNLPFNFPGFVSHARVLLEHGDLGGLPRTAASYATLAGRTVSLFRWSLGPTLSGLVVLGITGALMRRERRWRLWLLVVPISFYLLFTCVTMYVTDRFLLGGLFVLVLFAAAACADLIDLTRWQPIPRLAVGAALTYALMYAASINVMMSVDSRYAVRRWVARHAPAGTVVALVGSYRAVIDPPAHAVTVDASVDAVTRAAPDLIVLNARYAGRFDHERSPDGRLLLKALEDGTLGYEEVLRYRSPVPAWAVLRHERPMRGSEEAPFTNLDKVNPEMVIYRRRP
jgi:4-amino-4-deoxy-L-arabinose transferase-like glycosyltransferase